MTHEGLSSEAPCSLRWTQAHRTYGGHTVLVLIHISSLRLPPHARTVRSLEDGAGR